MAERLMGIETEYAVSIFDGDPSAVAESGLADDDPDWDGTVLGCEEFVYRLVDLAASEFRALPGMCDGVFLENGSRFYIDYGSHPELSTPECDNPWDLTRYVLAGERILARLVRRLGEEMKTRLLLFKTNVDYSGTRSTWGCHESYLHNCGTEAMSKQIIPHLVSRLIYTGAGGFNSFSPGVEFTISPREPHMSLVLSDNSTSSRGIFHFKDEPLGRVGTHRLHLLCGESLCSETSTWLKVGTTALVVAMIEAGLRPGEAVEIREPLNAMKAFSRDTKCERVVETVRGEWLTALEIQCHYLELAEKHAADRFMPPWAEDVCREWRRVLNSLLESVSELETTLDWAIKWSLYREHALGRGIEWETLTRWNPILTRLGRALEDRGYYRRPINVSFVLSDDSPVRDEVEHLDPFVREKGLNWDDLNSILSLRRELFEIDTRFNQLVDEGIFAGLDRAGALTHHVDGVDRIEAAMTEPPAGTRARIRGEVVRRLSRGIGKSKCDWAGVWDFETGHFLDLSDPFETNERWTEMPA